LGHTCLPQAGITRINACILAIYCKKSVKSVAN